MSLADASKHAAQRLAALPAKARVRIVAHLDADGISSAAIVLRALQRAKRSFHVTYTAEHAPSFYEALDHDAYEANVFVDLGASVLPTIAKLTGLQLVLDHHAPPGAVPTSEHLVIVNPHLVGSDGTREASGSTVALAFAVAMDAQNWDLAPHALVGAWGDRQERGGLQGWNAEVHDQARRRGLLQDRFVPRVGFGPLVDMLRRARPPWDAARVEDAEAFLKEHGLAPEATVLELSPHDAETLTSALVARMIAHGFPAYRVKELILAVPHSASHDGLALPRLVNLVSAAAREGEPGLGLAVLLGDPEARRELEALETRYHQTIRSLLNQVRADGVQTRRALHIFQVPQVAYVGEVCGLAMEYLLPRTHATLAFAPHGDQVRVSTRGTPELVAKGLDLATALRTAAGKVGGTGGGHTIASGATVGRGRLDEFLAAVDDLVAQQLGVS